MFDSVDEMVAENDHRNLKEDLEPGDQDPATPEYVFHSHMLYLPFQHMKQPGSPISRL
jgi:hypothetical protein